MTHVVAEPCCDCKHSDCVVVCPVDCFREAAQMLVIDPEVCIDCEACVEVCPVDAIYHESRLPIAWQPFRDLNATLAKQLPQINLQHNSDNKKRLKPEVVNQQVSY